MQSSGTAQWTFPNRLTPPVDSSFSNYLYPHSSTEGDGYWMETEAHCGQQRCDTKLDFTEVEMKTSANSFGKGCTLTESSSTSFHNNNGTPAAAVRKKRSGVSTPPRELKWGATGIRSSVLKRLQPPVGAESQDSSSEGASPELTQLRTQLRRLLDTLHDALSRLDHRRCLLVLTYLLHARHLVRREVLSYRRCGETVAALTYSTDSSVAHCAKTLLKLWRFGLTKGVATRQLKEVEKRLKRFKETAD